MKIFTPTISQNYQFAQATIAGGTEYICHQINGEKLADCWTPIPVELIEEADDGGARMAADFLLLGPISSLIVVNRQAPEEVRRLLLEFGELLPLSNSKMDLEIYNPRIIDALDQQASEVWRFKNEAIMSIRRHEFFSAKIAGIHIFRIPNLLTSPVYFSDHAVDVISRARLSMGVSFEEVWSD